MDITDILFAKKLSGGGGGGGESDFSTAEVTVTNIDEGLILNSEPFLLPLINTINDETYTIVGYVYLLNGHSEKFTIIMGKGGCVITPNPSWYLSNLTGDIERFEDESGEIYFIITGDCSFDISSEEPSVGE